MENYYNQKLLNIMHKYGVKQQIKSDSLTIHNILMNLFKTRCENKKTALWGAGRNNSENSHASVIIKKYTTYIQSLSFIIDSFSDLWGKEFMGYPIISPQDIIKNHIELVIISSKVQADSIKNDLKKYAPNCEYIDIYEELKSRGINIYHKFYEESSIYTEIHRIQQEYFSASDNLIKQDKLKNLISLYFTIKDISYGLEYVKEYINNKYNGWEDLEKFNLEIMELINEIKEKNGAKKDDIVIYFMDSLRAMDVFEKQSTGYKANMLKNYLDKAVVFTNARSTGVTTYESMNSVIRKKYPFDQNVYENNIMFEFEEFELLKIAESLHYDIHFYISEGYRIIKSTDKIKFTPQVYIAEKLWTLACDMAASDKKTFNFIYFPYELHLPLICGHHKEEPKISGFVDVGVMDTSAFIERQLDECKSYVDREMEYFRTFFSDDILITLFSDHSQVIFDKEEKKPYYMYYNDQDRCVGVTFFVKGWQIKSEWNEKLVSLYDFNDILKSIMLNAELRVKDNEIVRYQYYKIHNKNLREIAFQRGFTDYIDGINCFTSKEYLYVITKTGVEEVYKLDNWRKNIIDTDEGQLFIKKVKDSFDTKFPDFICEA